MKRSVANLQSELTSADLAMLLALARARTLAGAGDLLGVSPSTVFRGIQRLERGIGQRLFERGRSGYTPTDLAVRLSHHAETIETELAHAHSACIGADSQLVGTVRISAVDAVVQAFVIPALAAVRAKHPKLVIELVASNQVSNLTHRDVDIAIRSTNRPPGHLLGKRLGTIRFAVFGGKALAEVAARASSQPLAPESLADLPWVGVDSALPEHPGVTWRKRALPEVKPSLLTNTVQALESLIVQGLGVGVLSLFQARNNSALVPLTAELENCEIDLWLLSHPESRHLRRISEVATCIEAQFADQAVFR